MLRFNKSSLVINEDIRAEERPLCFLCDCNGTILYQDLRDRLFAAPGTWAMLRCPKCGLIWLNPQPIPEDIGKLYSEYFTHNTLPQIPKKEPTMSWRKIVKFSILNSGFGYRSDGSNKFIGWMGSRLGPLRDIVGGIVMWLNGAHPGKLLDVGCGNGQFLATMREMGWEVLGVEPDGQAVKMAQKRFGLNVYEGALEKIAFPDDSFDAITMSHVVEHLSDPTGTLRECQRVLKRGGRLVLTVPNIESLGHRLYRESWRGLEVPRHLFLFSPSTLRGCVEQAGLQVLELRTTARSANWMWATSYLIRRNGTIPGGSPKKLGFGLKFGGLAFKAVEEGLCCFTGAGEEIVLIATK